MAEEKKNMDEALSIDQLDAVYGGLSEAQTEIDQTLGSITKPDDDDTKGLRPLKRP